MKKLIGLWLIATSLTAGWSQAQSPGVRFAHFSTQQGLSNNFISAICQDREGFLWFGTANGLNRFDGYQFTTFQFDPKAGNQTLQHTIVTDVHEDRAGRLWVTTMGGGLHRVEKRTGKITAYNSHPGLSYYWNVHFNLFEDRKGLLWLGTPLGLLRFDPHTATFTRYPMERVNHVIGQDRNGDLVIEVKSRGQLFRFDPRTGRFSLIPLRLPTLRHNPTAWRRAASGRQFALPYQTGKPVSPYAFLLDRKGMLWIGTEGNGLFRVALTGGTLLPQAYNPQGLVQPVIYESGLFEDRSGFLWVTSPNGLQRLDPTTDQVLTYRSDPAQPGSLSSNDVRDVFRDRTGTVWIGTDNGIDQAPAHAKPFHTYPAHLPPAPVRLPEFNFQTVLEDHTGTIWLGSLQKGLFRWNPTKGQLENVPANPTDPGSLSSEGVSTLFEDRAGFLWVSTKEALHRLDRTTGKFTRYPTQVPAMCIDEDASGKLWIGGSVGLKGAIACLDPATAQFRYHTRNVLGPRSEVALPANGTLNHFLVLDLLVSRTGAVWVATARGLNRLDPATGRFAYYLADSTYAAGKLTDNWLRALYEDEQGILWVGTNHGGLNRFDPRTETVSYFTTREGLPSNQVVSIAPDGRGNLWLGTGHGISRFDPVGKTFRNFDDRDGLPDNECNLGSVHSRQGRLLFGTVNGAVGFQAEGIGKNALVPPVHLTGLKVLEKNRPVPAGPLELPYQENFLSFEFVALNYETPEKNRYAYRLEGLDPEWIDAGNRRFARYTDLRPGTYTFRVKASNNDGVWNQTGATLRVIIHPPWWQTGWAYGLYAVALVSLVLLARRQVVHRERLRNELTFERLTSEKLQEVDALKSRFFANLSHEFRTPLTLIRGTVEKLRGEEENAHRSDYRLIDRQADQLLDMINQLLELSKAESGKLVLHLQAGNLSAFLGELAGSFTALFESRQLRYRYTVPMQPVWVAMDQDKLTRILSNLLTNAAKFTAPEGVVQWSAMLEPASHQRVDLRVMVQDTGIGIPSDQLPRIFDRFYQVDGSATRAYEGVGIGLALVKELVELHGGTIEAASTEGEGTTFTVRLAFSLAMEHPTEPPQSLVSQSDDLALFSSPEPVPEPAGHRPLLLIIEDNADVRYYLRNCFANHYRTLEAGNGAEGFRQVLESLPDLIISDVMMPAMNGIELCQRLKTDERTSHIPIILLTAKASPASKLEGLETGADDYLTKPFDREELLLKVRNLLDNRERLRERFRQQWGVQPAAVTVPSTDEKFLQRVFALLESNLSNPDFDVSAFMEQIGMSQTHLHRKLTALLGQSANELIRTFRLKRAASLLTQQHGNVSEIAFQVGFSSPNYFTKCFKDHFGHTPTEYARLRASNQVTI
jgi:signal transduction histidine kinase/ligand-binding sensor domain-containing protein/CheY-like chemotaxis protein/AraC-like DNA-binding protein